MEENEEYNISKNYCDLKEVPDSEEEEEERDDEEKEELPGIVPCYYGVELDISQELVKKGLGALSIKNPTTNDNSSNTSNEENSTDGQDIQIQSRNSFWDIHRPELSKVNLCQKITQENVKRLLHDHVTEHGDFCKEMHNMPETFLINTHEKFKLVCSSMKRTSCEKEHIPDAINDTEQCVQLDKGDLHDEVPIRKCNGKFCVTIGQYREKHEKKQAEKVQFPEDGTQITDISKVKGFTDEVTAATSSEP